MAMACLVSCPAVDRSSAPRALRAATTTSACSQDGHPVDLIAWDSKTLIRGSAQPGFYSLRGKSPLDQKLTGMNRSRGPLKRSLTGISAISDTPSLAFPMLLLPAHGHPGCENG